MGYGVMVIEDEAVLARKIAKYLQQRDYEVSIATDGPDALARLADFQPEAVILDFNLPGGLNGLEVLERILAIDPGVRVIMVTGHGNVRLAVDAIKAGAYDYLSKPVVLNELKLLLDRAIGQNRTEGQLSYFHDRLATSGSIDQMLGDSSVMRRLKAQVARVVEAGFRLRDGVPPAVLISGETGTGKELVARALHFSGPRRERAFIELNVATIPAHLVESELFGYERGAFTDARQRKLGLVEAADGGTLFLDEIGELELPAQAKLLKLLEDRAVRRLGSVRDHLVDIQVVTATNRALDRMVAKGGFREDLYYRLNTIMIDVPPLRARDGDILMLARHFLESFARKYGRHVLSLNPDACELIQRHPWPGNVRELRNAMEQAVLHADGTVLSAAQLAFPASRLGVGGGPVDAVPLESDRHSTEAATLDDLEREAIIRALRDTHGNVSEAARRLGISRDRLRYRVEKYGLEPQG